MNNAVHEIEVHLQSASLNIMRGLFPPSSNDTLFKLLLPAACMTNLPTYETNIYRFVCLKGIYNSK